MKKITIAILTVVLVAVGAIFVLAQTTDKSGDDKKGFGKRGMHAKHGMRGKLGKRGRRGHMMGRAFRKLELTDAQKTQMQTIMKATREESKALRKQMHTNRQELHKLTENGTFNESQVTALANKQGDLHAKMIVQKQKVKAQMHAVLTSEQKAKLAEIKANRKKKMEERKARGAKRRGGNTSQ